MKQWSSNNFLPSVEIQTNSVRDVTQQSVNSEASVSWAERRACWAFSFGHMRLVLHTDTHTPAGRCVSVL